VSKYWLGYTLGVFSPKNLVTLLLIDGYAWESYLTAVQGCQIFRGTIFQNGENIPKYTKYTNVPLNIPNGHKICIPNDLKLYQYLPLQDPPKCTQIGIFGLKINHLATLLLFAASMSLRKLICAHLCSTFP
jgi:hypothetical protein